MINSNMSLQKTIDNNAPMGVVIIVPIPSPKSPLNISLTPLPIIMADPKQVTIIKKPYKYFIVRIVMNALAEKVRSNRLRNKFSLSISCIEPKTEVS